MSFVLKTNNRKKVSGSTLVAKIVSPDKKDYVTREYPVTVSVQTLSDKECVIRDIQQIDSILCSNNEIHPSGDGFILSNGASLGELGVALGSAVNGSSVSEVTIVNERDNLIGNDPMVQITNGTVCKVINSPIYDPQTPFNANSDDPYGDKVYKKVEFSITVSKGDYSEDYVKAIYVKAYSATDVQNKINLYLQDNLWDCIKGANTSENKVFTNFDKNFIKNIDNYAIDKIYEGTGHIFNKDNENINISLNISAPDFFDTLTNIYDEENCTITRLSASSMYQKKTSQEALSANLNIEPVRSFVSPTDNLLMSTIDLQTENKINNYADDYIFAYSCTGSDEASKFKCELTVQDLISNVETNNIKVISNSISLNDIRENIISSFMFGCFVDPSNADGGTDDTLFEVNSVSGQYEQVRKNVNVSNKNVYMRIPKRITSLFSTDMLNDTKKIGYSYYSSNPDNGGINDPFRSRDMFEKVEVTCSIGNGSELYIVDDEEKTTSNTTLSTKYEHTGNNDMYICIPSETDTNYFEISLKYVSRASLFKPNNFEIPITLRFTKAQS